MHRNKLVSIGLIVCLIALLVPTAHTAAFQTTPEEPADPNAPSITYRLYVPLIKGGTTVNNPPAPPSGPTIIDHNSVALFERIPDRYLTAARSMKVLFSDRSVGANFSQGLDCLASGSNFGDAPSYCRRHYGSSGVDVFNQNHYSSGQVPTVISFDPDPSRYSRNNWTFVYQEGDWNTLTCNFIQSLAPAHMDKDVLSYQFSYLNVAQGSDIMQFWTNDPSRCDIYDLEAFMARYPNKRFIMWTTSLARGIGSPEAVEFNNRMRQYARDRNLFLMDFAAIESYTANGQPCYDNRDGVPFVNPSNGNQENYPNDGINSPAICQDYTTETDGGHLGSVSGGMIRTAKAYWVLMARLAGWDGRSQ